MARILSRNTFKILGYPIVFIVFFTAFLVLSFPLESFHDDFEREITRRLEREVHIGDVGISMTGGLVFSNVEIEVPSDDGKLDSGAMPEENAKEEKKGAENKDSKPKLTYFIDEIVIKVGLLDLLFDKLSLDVDLEGLGGTMSVEYRGPFPNAKKTAKPAAGRRPRAKVADATSAVPLESKTVEKGESTPLSLRVEAEGISLKRLHDIRKAIPVPIAGIAGLSAHLGSATGLFKDSAGLISFSLKDVLLSRADFEVEVFDMKMAVPPLAISSVVFTADVKKGTGEVSKFELKSKHFDANVQGTVSLADPIDKSQLDLYVMFKVLPAYMDQSDSVKTLVSSLDSFSRDMKRAHRDDDYYGFRYKGIPGKGRFTPQTRYTPPGTAATTGRSDSRSKRTRTSRKRRPNATTKREPAALTPPSVDSPFQNDRPRQPKFDNPQFPPSDQIPRPSDIQEPTRYRPTPAASAAEEENVEEEEENVEEEEVAPEEEGAEEEASEEGSEEEGASGEEEGDEKAEEQPEGEEDQSEGEESTDQSE
jgi:type II secretion system protein N